MNTYTTKNYDWGGGGLYKINQFLIEETQAPTG